MIMALIIYHQLGHNYNWNFESISEDQTGDGVILAPRYMDRKTVELLPSNIKENAIFDPQFFLPDYPKGKLKSYDFFPQNLSEGFQTTEYSEEYAIDGAKRCTYFQESNDFQYLVIPSRRRTGMPSDLVEMQQKLFVDPFLNIISQKRSKKKPLLQIVLNVDMVKDGEYSKYLLNWITSLTEIGGVYLIVENQGVSKQLKDIDFLSAYLRFIDILSENGLDIVLGYLNTEALIYTLANPTIVTIGSFENLRRFSIRAFEQTDEEKQSGPTPRLYISTLLQSIAHDYINVINRLLPTGTNIFDKNKYQAEMFEPTFRWHFTKPALYKHAFLEFSKQLRDIGLYKGKERYSRVVELLNIARSTFNIIEEHGVIFDSDSDGSHLSHWLTAINIFAASKGWR